MRPASEVERRRLSDTFAALGGAAAEATAWATAELRAVGVAVAPADGAGNLLARVVEGSGGSVLFAAGLDLGGESDRAALAVLVELARRVAIEGAPTGLELLLSPGEDGAYDAAGAFDVGRVRSTFAYALDHAAPLGAVVMASPTAYRIDARFAGVRAAGGIPGDHALVAAARAVAELSLGRLDDDTSMALEALSGQAGAQGGTASLVVEASGLEPERLEAAVRDLVDHLQEAANRPDCACDVDVIVERRVEGYRHRSQATAVLAAEAALRACGYAPARVAGSGASIANTLQARGLPCTSLANGTERDGGGDERVPDAALAGTLDLVYALLDEVASTSVA